MIPDDLPPETPEQTWRRKRLPKLRGSVFGYIGESDLAEMRADPGQVIEEVIRNRRGVRRLAYMVILLALCVGVALGIFVARIIASDHRNEKSNQFSHDTACLFLANIPPDDKVAHTYLHNLRLQYPDCPDFAAPPKPTPSTTTRTEVVHRPGAVVTLPGGQTTVIAPGGTATVTGPGGVVTKIVPGPTVTRRVPGPTVTRTRTKTVAPSCVVSVTGHCVSLPAP